MAEMSHHLAQHNQLLAGLPSEEWNRLKAHLEPIALEQGANLAEGANRGYVYFPVTVTVSLLYLLEDGATSEVALVGPEGMVSQADFLGDYAPTCQSMVQGAGLAYRLRTSVLKAELEHSIGLHRLMMGHSQRLFQQMALTIVSSRHQAVEEQLCRRLLLGIDRVSSNTIDMTHEELANLLDVRREGISMAASRLRHEGLISYNRGHITVLDRAGLEAKAGECYAAMV